MTLNHPSILETSSDVTSEEHGFLALCRTVDYYALACTWPAPEMGRPGCVWTHTLLIGTELLAQLCRPEALLSLFRRPSLQSGFKDFLEGVPLPCGAESRPEGDKALGAELIRALYGGVSPYTVLTVSRSLSEYSKRNAASACG